MIPIRDSVRSRRFPWVTLLIIAINVIVFAHELTLSDQDFGLFLMTWGLVPVKVVGFIQGLPFSLFTDFPTLLTVVTSMFIHGGWLHIIGNMLYLWVFGDNVEDRLGRPRFVLFYLAAGGAGFIAHAVANAASSIPAVGASGAIAGVLGAYFLMFPQSRVLTIIPLGIFIQLAQVPAILFLFFWFILQVISGVASISPAHQAAETTAWWAHIGGFFVGMLWTFLAGQVGSRRRNPV